jgi:hypothetical protein
MKPTALPLLVACVASPALAHHGVAGVGAAALEGPGAPVESASSAVLPEGRTLFYAKLDDARFKRLDPTVAEADYSQFWMAGIGHGFTPWLSAYLFAPYNVKQDTPGGFTTRGWADVSVMGQLGFKYDDGLRLVPANESLDELEDWHFTIFAGASIPTGKPNLKDSNGDIDPGKSTGFGKSDWSLGLTATKMLTKNLTLNTELSTIRFRGYRYASDTTFPTGRAARFGPEDRLNLGIAYRFYTNAEQKFRADLSLETQFLRIGRDWQDGTYDTATGGKIVYLLPGVRLYKDNMSFTIGVKKPAWTRLNESDQQQGSEGKEKYRLIVSGSVLF